MNITFFNIGPLSFGGGFETYLMQIIPKLVNNGHNINVITLDKTASVIYTRLVFGHNVKWRLTNDQIKEKISGVNINEISILSLFPFSRNSSKIKNILLNSDIIYTKNEFQEIITIKYLIRNFKKAPPIICAIHTPIFYPSERSISSKLHNKLYRPSIYGRLLRTCTMILTQNKFDTELLISKYKIDRSKIIKLLPFVDTDFFNFKNIEVIDNKFKILFVGRLTEQKGIDILCKSIEHMSTLPEFSNMIFTIVGGGDLEYMIKELSEKYSNVIFLGFVTDQKLAELYNTNDIMVIPSRWETAQKVVLEAQSCGLPVITSNISGLNDFIISNITGLFIESNNHLDLYQKIFKLFYLKKDDKESYMKMKKMSVNNAEKYRLDIVVKDIENIFLEYSNPRKDAL